MSFFRNRRRYGALRLPAEPRRHHQVSWLAGDLRARRRSLLRNRARDLAVVLGSLTLSACGFTLLVRHSPVLVGMVLGIFIGVGGSLGGVFLSVVDGTFFPRLGQRVERSIGMDLRRMPGGYGVISNVSFEHVDVDHVVLTPGGCLAVEVKSCFSRRQELSKVADLQAKVGQARDGARRVQRLLRSRGVDIPVRPVLLLTGPGAPVMPPLVRYGDVTLTTFGDPSTWLANVGGEHQLDLATAGRAATELLARREQRTRYEESRAGGRQVSSTPGSPSTHRSTRRVVVPPAG